MAILSQFSVHCHCTGQIKSNYKGHTDTNFSVIPEGHSCKKLAALFADSSAFQSTNGITNYNLTLKTEGSMAGELS